MRVGNAAYNQNQHDVWGTLLDSVYIHTKNRDQLPESAWPILARQVEEAIAHWREPDRGIWEVRGEPKHFTSSKIFCWLALDRGARLARLRSDAKTAARWQEVADEIRADVMENGVDKKRQRFVQHYGSEALDAALLLIPLVRFLPGDDPLVRNTVDGISDELGADGLILRYKVDETDDGLEGEEGTFAICSWWMVSAFVETGELDRARQMCEKLLAYASPLLLYAEEIDADTGRHLGNFPQAFTHLALINAVMKLITAEEEMLAATPSPGKVVEDARMSGGVVVEREPDPGSAARRAAHLIAAAIAEALATRGAAHVALSGGNTPRETYADARAARAGLAPRARVVRRRALRRPGRPGVQRAARARDARRARRRHPPDAGRARRRGRGERLRARARRRRPGHRAARHRRRRAHRVAVPGQPGARRGRAGGRGA